MSHWREMMYQIWEKWKIVVKNGSMTPPFNSSINTYEVMVDDTAISLVLDYEVDNNNEVTVYGNSNLTSGENNILIEVYDGIKVNTYTLKVFKGLKETTIVNDEPQEFEIIKPTYDNSMIQILIIIIMIVIIFLFYRLIFNWHK